MKSTSTSPKTSAGIDIGHSMVKIAHGDHQFLFPSVAIPAITIHDEGTSALAKSETVTVNGRDWLFGDSALRQSKSYATGLNDDWVTSDEHAALFLGAVKKITDMGFPQPDVIVAGLPIQSIKANPDAKKILTQILSDLVPGSSISIIPQPYGAYCDLTLTDAGSINPGYLPNSISWGVIDIGFYTTDFIIINEGNWVEMASASCPGVSLAAESFVQFMSSRNVKLSTVEADKALIEKKIKYFGSLQDCSNEADRAIAIASSKIIDTSERLFADYVASLDGVLVVGGGAPIVEAGLKEKWPHAKFPEDSRMSVVRGMRKRAQYLAAKLQNA